MCFGGLGPPWDETRKVKSPGGHPVPASSEIGQGCLRAPRGQIIFSPGIQVEQPVKGSEHGLGNGCPQAGRRVLMLAAGGGGQEQAGNLSAVGPTTGLAG